MVAYVFKMGNDGKGNGDRLVPPKEAAQLLGVSVSTMAKWRATGRGPTFVKLGSEPQSGVRYRMADVRAFIEKSSRRVDEEGK